MRDGRQQRNANFGTAGIRLEGFGGSMGKLLVKDRLRLTATAAGGPDAESAALNNLAKLPQFHKLQVTYFGILDR